MFAVESQIVGYATQDATMGAQQMNGASFQTVGMETLDIQDVAPIGAIYDGCAWVKWWDTETKKYSPIYLYYTEVYDSEGTGLGYPGWGDENDWIPAEKTFGPGEGFWLQANSAGYKFQTSGEVYQPTTEYYAIPLTMGAQKMLINAFPTQLALEDLVIDGAIYDGCAWVKWWDTETKKYSPVYLYYTEVYDADGNGLGHPGWGDENDWIPPEKTFAVGEGFWVQANSAGYSVAFPNPFYVAPVK